MNYKAVNPSYILYNLLLLIIMKKGHRRTNSETITLSRPVSQKIHHELRQVQKVKPLYFEEFQNLRQKPLPFSSIQSLLQKCETNIAKRVVYVQNLEQPSNSSYGAENFTFGKGVNFKLNNFKLNMGQIPQVPKSNQSTSLQGQAKNQKELFFTHQPQEMIVSKHMKFQKQTVKSPLEQSKRTKTSSNVTRKPVNRYQKVEKFDKNQQKSTNVSQGKNNPLKRPKMQYQTHKKNAYSYGLYGNNLSSKIQHEPVPVTLPQEQKKKKKNYIFS